MAEANEFPKPKVGAEEKSTGHRLVEEDLIKERQGIPPDYVKSDPAGMTSDKMEEGLQAMREGGKKKHHTN